MDMTALTVRVYFILVLLCRVCRYLQNPVTIVVIYVHCHRQTWRFAWFLYTARNGVASWLLDEHYTTTGNNYRVYLWSSFNISSLVTNLSTTWESLSRTIRNACRSAKRSCKLMFVRTRYWTHRWNVSYRVYIASSKQKEGWENLKTVRWGYVKIEKCSIACKKNNSQKHARI